MTLLNNVLQHQQLTDESKLKFEILNFDVNTQKGRDELGQRAKDRKKDMKEAQRKGKIEKEGEKIRKKEDEGQLKI